jgi:hypothetical protein
MGDGLDIHPGEPNGCLNGDIHAGRGGRESDGSLPEMADMPPSAEPPALDPPLLEPPTGVLKPAPPPVLACEPPLPLDPPDATELEMPGKLPPVLACEPPPREPPAALAPPALLLG